MQKLVQPYSMNVMPRHQLKSDYGSQNSFGSYGT